MSCLRESNAEPIPGYRLIEPLGSGGFGEVWKCEAPGGLFKAIKFVFGNLNSLDLDGARAEQELHALNRVKEVRHPFVLGMDRIEILEGELVIVMELADRNLHDAFVEAQSAGLRGIPRDDLLRYLRDAAEALDYMCEKYALQHLDIKPRNLFLVSDRVKVADFGLVKHLERTGGSGLLGGVTPLYAPPETFAGKIHQHSDQYSLAIVYQELLTSQRPFSGKNARALAQQHMHEEPELRSLPEAERPLVARALSKDPGKRFPSCMAFVRALYNARTAAPGREGRGGKGRPKSIADTMEDIALENVFHDDSGPMPRPAALRQAGLEEIDPAEVEAGLQGEGSASRDVSELGLTAALPETGTLRPTLVIGLGSLGRRALMELRCRLLDRFGDLSKLPLFRFLYLDSDKAALQQSQRGTPEISLQPGEVYHLPLQPMAHYRRRQLDQLNEWLPREKLYALPRSLQTQGARALGRLAFSDNYLRLVSRLKRDIQAATHPDVLYQSVENTGLALRDNTPRIVLLGAATGGASGYLIDLAYSLRRQLRQLRQPDARMTAYLFSGAPDDPATPPAELANLYATLTEINHYSDGVTSFSAQYGADGQRQSEQGPPFDAVYLLTQRVRTPEARRDMVAHLGSYLFHELITPLGSRLERERLVGGSWDGPAIAFRSFGTHAVWFPRGLLLRLAARRAVGNLVRQWAHSEEESGNRVQLGDYRLNQLGDSPDPQSDCNPLKGDAVEAACARTLADPHLQSGALTQRIEEVAATYLEGQAPPQALAQVMATLEEQCWQFGGPDNPAAWATSALTRVRDWLGSGVQGAAGGLTVGANRKSRLNRALENACSQLAEEWDKKLATVTATLMALPGQRLAGAEAGLSRLLEHFLRAGQGQAVRRKELADCVSRAQNQLEDALRNCGGGGFRLFSWRPQRPLRVFLDLLAAFARQCLAEDTACAVEQFYNALVARLRDRLRDITLLRQRLRHAHQMLVGPTELDGPEEEEQGEEGYPDGGAPSDHSPTPMASLTSFWETSRSSSTTRVVLPDGEPELDRAAARFVASLTADHWACLDQILQDEVLAMRGGLGQAAFASNDLHRHLLAPLVDRAASCLSQYLPVTDVAQVELAAAGEGAAALARQLSASLEAAAPLAPVGGGRASARRDSKVLAVAGGPPEEAPGRQERDKTEPRHSAWLLVPASEAGRAYAEHARKLLPEVQLVRVPGQSDLMFCREQGGLTQEELERILAPCRDAYREASSLPGTSPHSRFDTRDWIPLDP